MPVDTHHAEYDANLTAWTRARDLVAGEDAVKAKGETYLPRLPGQSDTEYAAYKLRAAFFNATGRTVDGLVGLVFRKDPTVVLPAALKALAEDVDLAGKTLPEFARRIVSEVVQVGRGGILVEYPKAEVRDRTADEVKAENLRPYMTFYPAEKILDWRTGRVNNRHTVTMVKLEESVDEPDPADEWKRKTATQIRVLELTTAGVQVSVWRKTETGWIAVETFPLIIRGQVASEIPFVFVGPVDSTSEVQKAPIVDLVAVNLSHYRTSADYENGLHWTGVPTPVFIGQFLTRDGAEVDTIRLGSSEGIHLTEGGDAKYLEFEGSGLEGGLGKALERKEQHMAVLGARILANEKRAVEAAETAAIHRAGENSVLASLAQSVSKALTRALAGMAAWQGVDGEISFKLCTDYLPTPMDSQTLAALVAAWQAGALSQGELFEAFVAGEVIRSDKDPTEHESEIEAEGERRAEDAAEKLAATAKMVAARAARGAA